MAEMSMGPESKAPRPERENFRKTLSDMGRKRSSTLEVFRDFCRLFACELAMKTREEEYLAVAKGYTKEELNRLISAMVSVLEEMDAEPFTDILGPYYTEINSAANAQARGEYYTPPSVSKIMAQMLFSTGSAGVDFEKRIEDGKPITVQEPACGSGGMILSMAELFAPKNAVDLLRVTMIDVSPLACDMAYINTTLHGIPAKILQGDSLRWEFENGWKNFHWARVGEDTRQNLLKMIDLTKESFKPKEREKEFQPEKPNISFPPRHQRTDEGGQFQLGFDF